MQIVRRHKNADSLRVYQCCQRYTCEKNIVSIGGGAENAGVENAGAITYGMPSEEKTLRYQ